MEIPFPVDRVLSPLKTGRKERINNTAKTAVGGSAYNSSSGSSDQT